MDDKRNTNINISVSGRHLSQSPTVRQEAPSVPASSSEQKQSPSYSSTGRIQQIVNPQAVKKSSAQSAHEYYKHSSRKRTLYIVCTALAAISVIVIALMLRNMSEQESYYSYYDTGYASYQAGDYDSALTSLRKAYNISDTIECAILMSSCYELQGNYDKALEMLRQIDEKNPYIDANIARIEEKKDELANSQKIVVAGRQYDGETASVSLKDGAVSDANLGEITQLYSLTALTLSGNDLHDISPLSELAGLSTLDLSDNSISDISPVSSLSSLRILYLDNNPITDFSPLFCLSSLTTLSIKGIQITDTELQALTAALPNCAIHSENALETVNDISIGGITFKSDVTELNLSGLSLQDISVLSACRDLKSLDISDNNIIDLSPLMDLLNLEKLNFSNNQVVDVRPLMAMSNLRYINGEKNKIASTVPLSTIVYLKELYLSDNPVTDFSGLAPLVYLRQLALNNTGLKNDDLPYMHKMINLVTLSIKDNPELTGEAVDELKAHISSAYIEHSELVRVIEFGGERFNDNVTEINLENKCLTDISPVCSFNSLERLNLRNNSISNIYMFQYIKCNLLFLDLSNNDITDITSVTFLTSLEELDVSYNNIMNINPFMSLKNLKRLVLTGNYFTAAQIDELSRILPDCEIICEGMQ